jgi:hypothetical protein
MAAAFLRSAMIDGKPRERRGAYQVPAGKMRARSERCAMHQQMNSLALLAVVLLVAWIVLKMALAVTSVALHLLWVAALVMLVVWAIGKLRGRAA